MKGSVTWMPKFLRLASVALLNFAILAQEVPRSLYESASVVFERAQQLKPLEEMNTAVAYALAPLLIQEVKGTNSSSLSPHEVFFGFGSTRLDGREHRQVSYWWRLADEEISPGTNKTGHAAEPQRSDRWQGLRLTLGDSDRPVIYEVLTDPAEITQIYFAQSLEAAARAEFGPVLPGRRFAIEASRESAPRVLVPRVIEDAPVGMGPILYLRAGTREVATLICRCMDSQAHQLVGTGDYKLSAGQPPAAIAPQAGRLAAALRYPRPLAFGTNPSH